MQKNKKKQNGNFRLNEKQEKKSKAQNRRNRKQSTIETKSQMKKSTSESSNVQNLSSAGWVRFYKMRNECEFHRVNNNLTKEPKTKPNIVVVGLNQL